MSTWDAWNYRTQEAGPSTAGLDLVGYKVEATDGHIGKVDEATYDVGGSYIVVDTGPWIFGRRVMLPAGTVEQVNIDEETIYLDLTKDQIKNSPPLDAMDSSGARYRDELGGYYGGFYGGFYGEL